MSLNRTAKGIVLVPSLLLGGAFLAAAAWAEGPAADNKILALSLGGVLMGAGLLAQLLPEPVPERGPQERPPTPPRAPAAGGNETS
ncbi:MAG: GIVxVP protein [Cyanobacteriota bacterium]